MPVIPTTWEEEIGRLEVREQLGRGALSKKKFEKNWGYCSVVEYLLSMSEVLGSSWSTERKKKRKQEKKRKRTRTRLVSCQSDNRELLAYVHSMGAEKKATVCRSEVGLHQNPGILTS